MTGHDGHPLHPHEHLKTDDGRPKPCSGRFWCAACKEWLSRRPCILPGAPKLPQNWLS